MAKDYRFNIDQYMNKANKCVVLSAKEQSELAFKMVAGDEKAREKLIISNLRLVVKEAHRYSGYIQMGRITLRDLVQEGNMGLLTATKYFDPSKGYTLGTYARWWIKAYITEYIMTNYNMVKIGTTAAERVLFFKLSKISSLMDIKDQEDRQIATEVLAEKFKVKPKDIDQILQRFIHRETSLQDPITNNHASDNPQSNTVESQIASSHNTEEVVSKHRTSVDFYQMWNKIKPTLGEREVEIIQSRWLSEEGCTLREVGEKFGISRERIRQIESEVFHKLRTIYKEYRT